MWSTYTQPEIRAAEEILHKPIYLPTIDEVAMNYLRNYQYTSHKPVTPVQRGSHGFLLSVI